MTQLLDDSGAPLPLVVLAGANTKSDEHRIYLNHAGAKLLQGLLSQLLGGARDPAEFVWQNGEAIRLRLHTSTQSDFDCGGPPRPKLPLANTYRQIMPPIPVTAEEAKHLPPLDNGKPIKVLDPPDRDSLNVLPAEWPMPKRPAIPANQVALDDVQVVPADQQPTLKEQLPINAFMPRTLAEAHQEIITLRQRIRDKDV